MTNNTDIAKLVEQLNEKQKVISQQLYSGNEQMRGLAKRVWRVQEDERKHIARELHDGVGQLLTALINQLQQVKKGDDGISIDESIDLARQALSDTRVISRLMRPRILDDLGLIPALDWLVRIMAEPEKATIEFHHQVDSTLDSDTQTLAFRVIQEALTNAIKHAEAKLITLNLISTDNLLMIKIKDDGIGIAAGKEYSPEGFGLGAMRDRISAFGGQLTISSQPEQGCEIKVLVTGRNVS
ncbi:MAG: two-component system NarL family sensor kinase [Colwellia sp.]|jgi:two-component system NarL family sensor kinase